MKRNLELFPKDATISLPVRGTYTYDRKTGELISKKLEYAEFNAYDVADFILGRMGVTPKREEIVVPAGAKFIVGRYTRGEDGIESLTFLRPKFEHESQAYSFMQYITSKFENKDDYSIFMKVPGSRQAIDILNRDI